MRNAFRFMLAATAFSALLFPAYAFGGAPADAFCGPGCDPGSAVARAAEAPAAYDFYETAEPGNRVIGQNARQIIYIDKYSANLDGAGIFAYDTGDGSARKIIALSEPSPADPPVVCAGFLVYVSNYHLYLYELASGRQSDLGQIAYGKFAAGEGRVAYLALAPANGKTGYAYKIQWADLAAGKPATVIDSAPLSYPNLYGPVGDYLYLSGYSASVNGLLFARINLNTGELTALKAGCKPDAFYYDAAAKTAYISDKAGIQKFRPDNPRFYWVRRSVKLGFTDLGSETYKVLCVNGNLVYCVAAASFTYYAFHAGDTRGWDTEAGYSTLACAGADGRSFSYVQGPNTPGIARAYEALKNGGDSAELESLVKAANQTILQADENGAYYFYQGALMRADFRRLPVNPAVVRTIVTYAASTQIKNKLYE